MMNCSLGAIVMPFIMFKHDLNLTNKSSTITGPKKTYCTDKNWRYDPVKKNKNAFKQTSLKNENITSTGMCPNGPFSVDQCGCLDLSHDGKVKPGTIYLDDGRFVNRIMCVDVCHVLFH